MTTQALVTIDDAVIDRLRMDPQAVAALPFLRNLKPSVKKVRTCCNAADVDYAGVKQDLAALDSATLRKLKQILNAKQIRFYRPTRTAAGKAVVVKHTK